MHLAIRTAAPTSSAMGDTLPSTVATRVREEADPRSVTVKGQEAALYGDYFVAEDVPLNTEGSNAILVVATDQVRRTGQDQITVTRDTTAPNLAITSPQDGSTAHTTLVTVSGTVEAVTVPETHKGMRLLELGGNVGRKRANV